MKQTYIVKPSATPVTVTVDITDPQMVLSNNQAMIAPQLVTFSESGYTAPPVVVEPPVVVPPAPVVGIPATARQVFGSDFTSGFGGFETVDIGGGKTAYAQLGRGVIATDPDNASNKVFNAIVNAGDKAISSGFRSELTLANMPMTGEMYFSFRVRFNKSAGSDQGHFFQIHPSNDTGSAAFALYFNGNKFSVIRSLKKGENIYEKPSQAIALNKWYNILVHNKWSSGSDGFAQVYIDGKLFLDIKGQTLPGEGGYYKQGANIWSGNTGSTPEVGINIMYDDIKIYRA